MNISKFLLSGLIFAGFIMLPGFLLAQTASDKLLPLLPSVEKLIPSVIPVSPNSSVSAPSSAAVPPTTSSISSAAVRKCGVNTFVINNECGIGTFKNMYVQCHDGYEENQGGESSCKSSEAWQKYAKEVCANRCGTIKQPVTSTPSGQAGGSSMSSEKPSPVISEPVPLAPPIAVCAISDVASREYDALISELKKAESSGDRAAAEEITQKIMSLRQEIAKSQQTCRTNTVSQTKSTAISVPTAVTTGTIDRCGAIQQWEEKIRYYKKLAELDEVALKNEYNFSWDEVKKILSDLETGLEKVRTQCVSQSALEGASGGKAVALLQVIAEPIMPVAVQSAREINDYYKEKMQSITTAETSAENQIHELKILKEEKDSLTEQLIKNRKEIEATELNSLANEIRVRKNEIKAGDISIQTTGKKILLNFENTAISIEPLADQVVIREKLEIRVKEISIEGNKLKVGDSEVKLLASDVADKLGISAASAELKEENFRAVYELETREKRKLFGFIPLNVLKTVTADAANGDLLDESLPWYAFLTTK